MTNVRILSQKFESIMQSSPTQSLLFEDEALQCYKNNIKWLLSKNLTMKKLSKDSFSKPENRVLSNTNFETNQVSDFNTQCTNFQAGQTNSQFDRTELDSEIAKWNQSNNGNSNITQFSNYPNFNQLYQTFKQQPHNITDCQRTTINSSQQKYNNWKQITVQNQNAIENELEQQQRKELIMSQLDKLEKEQEAQLQLSKKPAVLNLSSNLASRKIMIKISSFASQVRSILSTEQRNKFNQYVSLFFDWLELNNESIKNYMSESIAQVILYLVACNIGISRTDFIKHLRPDIKNNRNRPKIDNIKKLICYPILKGAFKNILENAK